ncbi:MAG: AsmA-like C-terminal region-containing protein [Myxococcota bacterium]
MRTRRLLLAGGGALGFLGLGLLGGWMWLHTDAARHRFEVLASEALHRQVTVDAIDVQLDALELSGLTVAGAPDDTSLGQGEPGLEVDAARFELRWSALLDGGLAGTLHARDFDLRVAKQEGATNWHGIRRRRSGDDTRPLDLRLVLDDGTVTYRDEDRGEEVVLRGVALAGRVETAEAHKDVTFDARAAEVEMRDVVLEDVALTVQASEVALAVTSFEATLDEAAITGDGALAFDRASSWSARVDATGLSLGDAVLPVVVAAFPAAAGLTAQPVGATQGQLSISAEVQGSGLKRASVMQSLAGSLGVSLNDVVLPKETVAVRVAALLGRTAAPLPLPPLSIDARIDGPWVRVAEVRSEGDPIALPFEGRVALDGRLDLQVDVLPLLGVMPEARAGVRRYANALPVRVEGTVQHPEVLPPSAGAVAKAVAGAWIERSVFPDADR